MTFLSYSESNPLIPQHRLGCYLVRLPMSPLLYLLSSPVLSYPSSNSKILLLSILNGFPSFVAKVLFCHSLILYWFSNWNHFKHLSWPLFLWGLKRVSQHLVSQLDFQSFNTWLDTPHLFLYYFLYLFLYYSLYFQT